MEIKDQKNINSVCKKPIMISFYSHKGGVGKTTSIHNFAYILSETLKYKVLLIDADPQCSLSGLILQELINGDSPNSVYECFKKIEERGGRVPEENEIEEQIANITLVKPKKAHNLFFLQGNLDLALLEKPISLSLDAKHLTLYTNLSGIFCNTFRKIARKENIDIILIDLNPGASILNGALLMGSDYFVVPFMPDHFSAQAIQSLAKIIPSWDNHFKEERLKENSAEEKKDNFRYLPKDRPKFLGVIPQRVNAKIHKKSKQYCPVTAYKKWLKDIHGITKEKFIPELEKCNMLSTTFKYKEGYFIENFNAAGVKAQDAGVPIIAYTTGIKIKKVKEQFHAALFNLFNNMEESDKETLDFESKKALLNIEENKLKEGANLRYKLPDIEKPFELFIPTDDKLSFSFPFPYKAASIKSLLLSLKQDESFQKAAAFELMSLLDQEVIKGKKGQKILGGALFEEYTNASNVIKERIAFWHSNRLLTFTADEESINIETSSLSTLREQLDENETSAETRETEVVKEIMETHFNKFEKEFCTPTIYDNFITQWFDEKNCYLDIELHSMKLNKIGLFERLANYFAEKHNFQIHVLTLAMSGSDENDEGNVLGTSTWEIKPLYAPALEGKKLVPIVCREDDSYQYIKCIDGEELHLSPIKKRKRSDSNQGIQKGEKKFHLENNSAAKIEKEIPDFNDWPVKLSSSLSTSKGDSKDVESSHYLSLPTSKENSKGKVKFNRASECKLIALYNHKGGVGKTTTCFNLSYILAQEKNKRVLLVDADSQCNLSSLIMGDEFDSYTEAIEKETDNEIMSISYLYKYIIESRDYKSKSFNNLRIFKTRYDNLFLLPGKLEGCTDLEIELTHTIETGKILKKKGERKVPGSFTNAIRAIADCFNFDYVLIDINPSTSSLNKVLIMGSDYIIVPYFPDYLSHKAIVSLSTLLPKWSMDLETFRAKNIDDKYCLCAPPKLLQVIPQKYPKSDSGPFSIKRNEIYNFSNSELVNSLAESKLSTPDFKLTYLKGVPDFTSIGLTAQKNGRTVFDIPHKDLDSAYSMSKTTLETKKKYYKNLFVKIVDDMLEKIKFYQTHSDSVSTMEIEHAPFQATPQLIDRPEDDLSAAKEDSSENLLGMRSEVIFSPSKIGNPYQPIFQQSILQQGAEDDLPTTEEASSEDSLEMPCEKALLGKK